MGKGLKNERVFESDVKSGVVRVGKGKNKGGRIIKNGRCFSLVLVKSCKSCVTL